MSHVGQAYHTGSVPTDSLAMAIRPTVDSDPGQYINIRLTNGSAFYTAGGTSVSGGGVLTSDQGSPNLLANAWPFKLTDGSNVLATSANPAWVTGSITVTNPDSRIISGSITGLLVGGVPLASTNPLWVTGSVGVTNAPSSVTIISGSVSGLLVGGQPVSNANPVPTSQQGVITVTGSVKLSELASLPAVDQGSPNLVANGWPVKLTDGSNVLATPANPAWVTGSVYVINPSGGASGNVTAQSGSVTGLLVGGVAVSNANPVPLTGTVVLGRAIDIASLPNVTVGNTVTVAAHSITSGSVSGLLVGGVALSNANPVPISDAGGSITVDGTVSVGTPDVTLLSGSVSGLLLGGQPVSNANGIPVTDAGGSITVDGTVAVSSVGGTVTVAAHSITSGSVTGLLVGGVSVANSNPVPISDAGGSLTIDGSVSITGTPTVTAAQGTAAGIGTPWPVLLVSGSDPVGTVSHPLQVSGSAGILVGGVPVAAANPLPISDAGASLTVDGTVTATQGTAAGIGSPWPVIIVSGSDPVGTTSHPMWVTGSVYVLNQGGAGSNVTALSGSVAGLLVGGVALSNANPIPIGDAGGSITVDGTVAVSSVGGTVTVAAHSITSGSITGLLVGGVNVANSNPVPISDAGGSLTVDGTVAVSSATVVSGSISGLLVGGVALSNANPIPISDAGGSITVDGTVAVSSVGGTVTVAAHSITSGSVTGLLIGGVNVSNAAPVPISDAGGSLTVDGTVAVSSATVVSGSISGLLVGGVALSNANPVPISDAGGTITVDGTVTANVASTVINSGSLTGLLVGGVALSNANRVPVTGSVASEIFTNGAPASVTNPLYTTNFDTTGQVLSGSTLRLIQYKSGDYGTSGSANQVIAPQGAGNKIRVLSAHAMTLSAVNFRWISTGSAGTITNKSGLMPLAANGGFVLPHNPHGWLETEPNEGLNVSLSTGNSVGLILTWIIVS